MIFPVMTASLLRRSQTGSKIEIEEGKASPMICEGGKKGGNAFF